MSDNDTDSSVPTITPETKETSSSSNLHTRHTKDQIECDDTKCEDDTNLFDGTIDKVSNGVVKTKGKAYADERRRLYKIRHSKDRNVRGSDGFYADKLLW